MDESMFRCEQCGFVYDFYRNIRCPRCFQSALKYNSCQGCKKCNEKECDTEKERRSEK